MGIHQAHSWCALQPRHEIGRNTFKRILLEGGIDPAPERSKRMSWSAFLRAHWGAIAALDFLTVEPITWFRTAAAVAMVEVVQLAAAGVEAVVAPGACWGRCRTLGRRA